MIVAVFPMLDPKPPKLYFGGFVGIMSQDDDSNSNSSNGNDGDYADFNEEYFSDFYEHEKMLADTARMDFYHSIINANISKEKKQIVLDVGTGSGILAAFASRAGASYVYALDHNENVVTCAEEVAKANQIENTEFVIGHSSDFSLPIEPREVFKVTSTSGWAGIAPNRVEHRALIQQSKVDVILHEQMGDCLFDEEMIRNICDLRDRLLKPGGMIVPSCYDLFVEPVHISDHRSVPFIWQMSNIHGYDFSCLHSKRARETYGIGGDDNRGYYHVRSSDPSLVQSMLSAPSPVLSLDLHTVRERQLTRRIVFSKTVTATGEGRVDGFAVYFRCRGGGGGGGGGDELVLETGPHSPNRGCHWGYRVLRCEGEAVAEGDVLDVSLNVGSWADLNSWRWQYSKRGSGTGTGKDKDKNKGNGESKANKRKR